MSSSDPTFHKTRWGNIPKLPHANYDTWKDSIIFILSAMRVYAIVSRDDSEPQPADFNHEDNYDQWKAKEAEAALMIKLFFSPEVRRIFKGMRNTLEVWNTLKSSLDTTGSSIGRQDILRQFGAYQHKEDEPLQAYFTKLSNYRIQLDHTDDAITYWDFRTPRFISMPSLYATILMVLMHRSPLPTPEKAMHNLLEEETTASLNKDLRYTSTGAALTHNMAATMAKVVGVVVVVAEDAVDVVNTVETVDWETATTVSALIAKLTAILQMHAESANAPRREETTEIMNTFASNAVSQATPKLVAYPTNVWRSGGKWRKPLLQQPSL